MKKPSTLRAFSLIELFIVVAVLAVVLFTFLPGYRGRRSMKLNCTNNLKQIGLSFKTFAIDNEDKFPFQLSTTNGGTMELASAAGVWQHFSAMSNELSTPKVLACPNDSARLVANSFGASTASLAGQVIPLTNDSQVSYFINLEGADTKPQVVLSGDACLGTGKTRLKGVQKAGTNSSLAWVQSWHGKLGNILLVDGSVHQVTSRELKQFFVDGGVATNRLILP